MFSVFTFVLTIFFHCVKVVMISDLQLILTDITGFHFFTCILKHHRKQVIPQLFDRSELSQLALNLHSSLLDIGSLLLVQFPSFVNLHRMMLTGLQMITLKSRKGPEWPVFLFTKKVNEYRSQRNQKTNNKNEQLVFPTGKACSVKYDRLEHGCELQPMHC